VRLASRPPPFSLSRAFLRSAEACVCAGSSGKSHALAVMSPPPSCRSE